jgi:MYXO-CTERM domain-containing protein
MSRATIPGYALSLLALPLSLALAPEARAQAPFTADLFEVTHAIPTLDGASAREMTAFDRLHFLNRARCECGQPLRTEIRIRPDAPELDNTKLVQSYIGPQCATAEGNPVGQFRRCGVLKSGIAADYVEGYSADHHPIFVASGTDLSAGEIRSVGSPDTILANDCSSGSQGESGAWICAQTNVLSGCQADEFIWIPADQATDELPQLRWDFLPPVTEPADLTATAAGGSVQLRWQAIPGDINGYRVLCERNDNGEPAPNQSFAVPDLLDEADGTHYFTKQNLCGDDPFLTFISVGESSGDGTCGDGKRDDGEACDDGEGNGDDGLCRSDCTLAVSPGLHALDWDYLCSDHITYNEKSVNIHGLENGVEYRFVLVSYDTAGNPRAVPQVLRATPDAALDPLPGAPEEGCACRSDPTAPWPALLLLPLLALTRRRR